MKLFLSTAVFLGLILARAAGQTGPEVKNYASKPLIKRVLADYADGKVLDEIRTEPDANLRFLAALEKVILLDKARAQAKGSHYLNLGITGHNGTVYLSGIASADIADEVDRKFYESLLQRNRDNLATVNKLVEAKDKILELIRTDLPKVDGKWRDAAGKLADTVAN